MIPFITTNRENGIIDSGLHAMKLCTFRCTGSIIDLPAETCIEAYVDRRISLSGLSNISKGISWKECSLQALLRRRGKERATNIRPAHRTVNAGLHPTIMGKVAAISNSYGRTGGDGVKEDGKLGALAARRRIRPLTVSSSVGIVTGLLRKLPNITSNPNTFC